MLKDRKPVRISRFWMLPMLHMMVNGKTYVFICRAHLINVLPIRN